MCGLTEDQQREFDAMKTDALEHRELFDRVVDPKLWPERDGMTYREARRIKCLKQIEVWREWRGQGDD